VRRGKENVVGGRSKQKGGKGWSHRVKGRKAGSSKKGKTRDHGNIGGGGKKLGEGRGNRACGGGNAISSRPPLLKRARQKEWREVSGERPLRGRKDLGEEGGPKEGNTLVVSVYWLTKRKKQRRKFANPVP